ncbi:MAG: lipopolysaccharide biosynthesis protein [Clostridia bacterium]|nr:lipopolysaccharide biosynthesis protein [Clostridia bacterium]
MKNQKVLSTSQNSLYNMIGTMVYCFCQWVTSALLVVHLSPEEISVSNTGLLQLAISVTNIFYAISTYNVRTYQISDTQNQYASGDYIGVRFITAVSAVVLCVGYVLVLGYSARSVLCIVFYMFYKLNETFSDVLHGINQKNHRMDYVGISYVMRGMASTIVFAFALITTGDVLVSIIAMAVVALLIVVLYDVKSTKQFGSIKPIFNKKTITALLITCLPAVVSSASFTAITSIPRQMLEGMRGEEALGYYGTIATPLVVVQVMATSIFNPMLTELAELYNEGKIRDFVKQIAKNLGLLICIAVIVCLCVMLFGKFTIGLVFGEKFVPYTYLMYGIIGCTTMYVISWLCTNTLIIMRKLKVCMIASLIALGVSALLAKSFINLFEMNGVSYSIIIAYIIHISVCSIIIYKNLKLKGNEK